MTPRQYWTACRLHDWFYSYSDDPGVYRAGKEDRERLLLMTENNPALADIFRAWQDHHFDCGPVPAEPKHEQPGTELKKETKMNYTVESGIPFPRPKKRGGGRSYKYPFKAMKKGDSFFVEGSTKKHMSAVAYQAARRIGRCKFTVAETTENGISGARVWRSM